MTPFDLKHFVITLRVHATLFPAPHHTVDPYLCAYDVNQIRFIVIGTHAHLFMFNYILGSAALTLQGFHPTSVHS